MLKNLLKLRVNQLIRLVNHTGIGLVLVFMVVTMGFSLSLMEFLVKVPPLQTFIFAFLLLLTIHFKRNDLPFLNGISDSPISYRLILFVEYLLILLPIAFFFLCFKKWNNLIPLVIAPLIAASLPTLIWFKKSDTKIIVSILPTACFELKTHIEKNIVGYGLIGLIGLGSAFHVSLFILFAVLFGANILAAFQKLEPKEMVVMTDAFLLEKIKRNVRLVLLLSFPFFSIALLFQFHLFYVVIYFYLTVFLAITFGVLYKYAYANPLYPDPKTSIAQSIFFILPYLPGLIIANIGYQFYLWSKANRNLKKYYA